MFGGLISRWDKNWLFLFIIWIEFVILLYIKICESMLVYILYDYKIDLDGCFL